MRIYGHLMAAIYPHCYVLAVCFSDVMILSYHHRQRTVLGAFHYLALSRTLVVDAAEVQYAVYDHPVQLLIIVFAVQFGVGFHGVERYYYVAAHDVVLVVVEGYDVRVIVVSEIFAVHLENLLVVHEHVANVTHALSIGGCNGPYP